MSFIGFFAIFCYQFSFVGCFVLRLNCWLEGVFGNEPLELRRSAACGALATLVESEQLESNQHGRWLLKIERLLAANFGQAGEVGKRLTINFWIVTEVSVF